MKVALSTATLATAFSLLVAPALAGPGDILFPHPGTQIAPGASFNFTYDIRADYCTSTYAYSVFLVTETPADGAFAPADVFMGGHFFGRFDAENYPAVPVATHPAPPQLVMPNFSLPEGGWGAGESASDRTFQLAVLEEWDGCDASGPVGTKFSLAVVPIVYNATGTH